MIIKRFLLPCHNNGTNAIFVRHYFRFRTTGCRVCTFRYQFDVRLRARAYQLIHDILDRLWIDKTLPVLVYLDVFWWLMFRRCLHYVSVRFHIMFQQVPVRLFNIILVYHFYHLLFFFDS